MNLWKGTSRFVELVATILVVGQISTSLELKQYLHLTAVLAPPEVVASAVDDSTQTQDHSAIEKRPDPSCLKLNLVCYASKQSEPSESQISPDKEVKSDLYQNPEPIVLDGYEGSAMEPFISPDGRYLFFNNENDSKVKTSLQFARRTGNLSFAYLGELPGVKSRALDAVASIDKMGNFYFTTLRSYGRTLDSIFTGKFDGKAVHGVHPVLGSISPRVPGEINMDVSVGPDGRALYISRTVFVPGVSVPQKSEILVANLKGSAFYMDPLSKEITRNINSDALQYAPCISADGLELYFTRASKMKTGQKLIRPLVRIMVATRRSLGMPFGEPQDLASLTGFVEAPTVSLDGHEMFYHKKVGQRFVIFRAVRKPI